MKIILAKDVETLGHKGDVVTVSDGYARNYLVPKGMALVASRGALKQAEQMRRAREEALRKAKDEAVAQVALLGSSPVYISARAGEDGKLFGSVTKNDIARAVQDQLEQDVDARQVRLDESLRRLGTFSIEVHLHEEVNALVSVEVIAHEEDA
ncbi:MAG: 50S ribosomal protein L9 [Actinomycetota bacterium]|nr:50S ribosomal protein L9 [Actinomycetota bacterium]HZK51168.1 50S ribosomal protein L9 [Actinomycetota bacterium]